MSFRSRIASHLSSATRLKARFVADYALPHYLPRIVRHKWKTAIGGKTFPDELFVFVTNRCNARCKHCFYIDELGDTSGEWSLADWERLAATLPELEHLTLTGGEALLSPDINDIAFTLCKAAKPKVLTVISNGLRPQSVEDFALRWLELGDKDFGGPRPVLDVLFSLDGFEATHNDTRGVPGAWTNVNDSIKRLARLRDANLGRIDVGVVTVITDSNKHELKELAAYVSQQLQVRQGFEFVRGTNTSVWGLPREMRADFNPSTHSLPPRDELSGIVDLLRELNRQAGSRANFEFFTTNVLTARMLQGDFHGVPPCVSAGRTTGVLYPNGDIACCEFMKPFGNLRDDFAYDFAAAWHSSAADKCRQAARRCRCTHGCYLSRNIALSPSGLMTIVKEL